MKNQSEQNQRWEDIIFEKRNKEYGAYAIRKDYKTRILKAEAISIGIGALIFIIPILMRDEIPLPVLPKPDPGIVLDLFDGTIEPIITPPPPPQPPRRIDASIIPTHVVTTDVVEPPIQPSDEVSYAPVSETTGTEAGPAVIIGSNTGTMPVDVPAPAAYVLAPEVMPSYVGGMEALMKFIRKKVHYPKKAQERHDEGTVYVSFVVNASGDVTSVEVLKGISKECDQEAARVISIMEKWKPGMQNKMPVSVKMVLPIKFKLDS